MVKGGPYWHVIRFLDHPLLPANAGPDVPKIIKHGINDDGPMHPKSPHVSAPDGAVTLMYKMGRDEWLQRFLDVNGTQRFKLVMKWEPWQDLYIQRDGRAVEIGFLSSYSTVPQPGPGVRYHIQPSGEWTPIATSDLGSQWGGMDVWVRGQGEAIAKGIWYHTRWGNASMISIHWAGITADEKEENRIWCEDFIGESISRRQKSQESSVDRSGSDTFLQKPSNKKGRECRGGCGTTDAMNVCGRCKETHYCSPECQKDDWKWHKSVCGKDLY